MKGPHRFPDETDRCRRIFPMAGKGIPGAGLPLQAESFPENKNPFLRYQKKLALAFALSHRAELLIMDEPTSGLDPLIRDKFLSLIREFMDKGGKGVLFSTHITSDLDKCADNIVFLHQGKILLEEDKDILLDKWRLVKGGLSPLQEGKKEFLNCLRTTDYGSRPLCGSGKSETAFPCLLDCSN